MTGAVRLRRGAGWRAPLKRFPAFTDPQRRRRCAVDPRASLQSQRIVLVECGAGSVDDLASRARSLGVDPIVVPGLEAAEEVLGDGGGPVLAICLPTELSLRNLKKALRQLRSVGPASGLTFVSVGRAPDRSERKQLRNAGMQLALWEPYDDGTLRFQLNRALTGDRADSGRVAKRAPTFLMARIEIGGRTKDAILYSLSESGAFLETPRASMDGAGIQLWMHLPGRTIEARAVVIFTNVPGNLQRPNLPLGMGCRFDGLPDEDRKAVKDYVEGRLAELTV